MSISSAEIVRTIKEKFPHSEVTLDLGHCAQTNLEIQTKRINQLILGLTRPDLLSGSINRYKLEVATKMKDLTEDVSFFSWPFSGLEMGDLKDVLHELAETWNMTVDVEELLGTLHLREDELFKKFYLVVTVVSYEVKTLSQKVRVNHHGSQEVVEQLTEQLLECDRA